MKRLFTMIASLMFLLGSWNSAAHIKDDRSTEILSTVSAHYKAYTTMRVKFSMKMDDARSESTSVSNGTLDLKGENFRVKLGGQEVFCDGTTLWTYIEAANEVEVSTYEEDHMDISPSNFFRLHESGFMHRYAGKATVGTTEVDLVELTPTDKDRPYFKVSLYVTADGSIQQFAAKMKSGVTTTYRITSFTGNAPLEDSHFKFNAADHPGVVEIDLR